MPTWAWRLTAHCCTARGAVPLWWQVMHAWLSLEVLVASFATSGTVCPHARLVKRAKNPKVAGQCSLLIVPPYRAILHLSFPCWQRSECCDATSFTSLRGQGRP